MDLIEQISAGTGLGAHTWRIDRDGQAWVAKAFCHPPATGASNDIDDPFQIALSRVDGIAHWTDFYPLDDQQRQMLRLDDGSWFLALRPFVDGEVLADVPTKAATRWAFWARKIALSLRGLHAQKWVHADLRPAQVVIDGDDIPRLVGLSPVRPRAAAVADADAAPFRAPELWDEQQPAPASDVYALAILICWMASGGDHPIEHRGPTDWERAHRNEEPTVPHTVTPEVAAAVKRSLSKRPELRPQIQVLVDELMALDDTASPPFFALPPSLYRGLEKNVIRQLDAGARAVVLEGAPGTGKSFALERLLNRLHLAGRRVIHCSPGAVRGPEPGQMRKVPSGPAPWGVIRRLLEALGGDENAVQTVTGDFLYVFETWTKRLQEVLPPGETILLWDDLDASGPDVRAFWDHALDALWESADETGKTLRLVAVTDAEQTWDGAGQRVDVTGPDESAWSGWRVRTRLAGVRDIDDERWQKLVAEHGRQPVHLFAAIHDELGVETTPPFATPRAPSYATPDVSVIFAGDWRRHLDTLMNRGAYLQAIDTCRRLYEVLARSGRAERVDILAVWLEALARTGYQPVEVVALERALTETGEPTGPGADALLLQGRLYCELGWYSEALSALDALGAVGEGREVELLRWHAQILVSSGQLDSARQIAAQGLTLIEESTAGYGPARRHLMVVERGARAMNGDREAMDALQRLAAAFQEHVVDPRLRARCHVYRAVGRTRCGDLEQATDAYLRALEEIETAGQYGQLPPYLLDVGTAYRRQGHLGIAREYYARGRRHAHEGTRHSTRALLVVHEAHIDIALGRFERARKLVERAAELADTHGLGPVRAMCRLLAGDIERRRGHFDQALQIYESALDEPAMGHGQRARLLLRCAEAALGGDDEAAGSDFVDRARRLIEEYGLDDLEHHHGVVRARCEWSETTSVEAMTGVERFRRHLLAAADADDHKLVLEQSRHLWNWARQQDQRGLMVEVSKAFHRARDTVAIGLSPPVKTPFLEHLPPIPTPDRIDEERVDDEAARKLAKLQREHDALSEQNATLERRLAERESTIETLQRKIEKLEEKLAAGETPQPASDSEPPSRRGRRPKATRDDVVEAMERFERDYDKIADHLGVSKRTVYRYVKKFGLQR